MTRARPLLRAWPAALAVVAAEALVGAGFAAAGRPAGIAAAAGCAVAWLAVAALAASGSTALLVATLALEVLGALAGAPAWLCAAATASAVAAWDLSAVAASAPRDPDPVREARVMAGHLRALAVGLGPGVVLAAALGWARVELPFWGVLALGLAAVLALDQASRHLERR